MNLKQKIIICNAVFAVTSYSEIAQSHEYEAYARSATGTGRAYAGEVAKSEDATSVFANPAAMAHLDEDAPHFSGVFHVLKFNADYDAEANIEKTGELVQGVSEGDAGGLFGGPNIYWVKKSNGKLNYGFGLNTPYAYGTDYESDWVGRYHGTSSELTVLSMTNSLSYRLNNSWSIGASLPINYSVVDFERALNQQGKCTDLNLNCSTIGSDDGFESISADGVGLGFNAGLHYQSPSKNTQLGLVYRSKQTLDLSGDADYRDINNTIVNANIWRNTDVDVNLILPESITLGGSQKISNKLSLMSDVTWTNWDQFDGWTFEFDNTNQDAHRIATNWGDGVRLSVALDYKYSDKLTLRMGYAFDNSPVNEPSQQSPLIPGADINWFTFGASWLLRNGARLDLGYAFLDYDDADITANSNAGTNENILFNSRGNLDLHLISAQYNF